LSRIGEVLSRTIEWFCRSSASSRNDSSTPQNVGMPLIQKNVCSRTSADSCSPPSACDWNKKPSTNRTSAAMIQPSGERK